MGALHSGSSPLGRGSRSHVVWRFVAADSDTGGHMLVRVERHSKGRDRLIAAARVKHVSTKRRSLRAAARLVAIKELRRLARWATERADAMVMDDAAAQHRSARRQKRRTR